VIFKTEQIGVAEDATLRVQKECVAPITRLHLLDLIGGHGVQQTRTVFSSDADLATRR
jgi:hypothetical protein